MIDYLDAFVDHDSSFQSYLEMHETTSICKSLGFKQRDQNHHHPKVSFITPLKNTETTAHYGRKRFGINIEVDRLSGDKQNQPQVPGLCLTKEEFYDLCKCSS